MTIIYTDLDGVLCDYDAGCKRIGVRTTEFMRNIKQPIGSYTEVEKNNIRNYPGNFWAQLGWLNGGPEVWEYIKDYNPYILTGKPKWDDSATLGKHIWCKANLGLPEERVLVVLTKDKKNYANPGDILIDDFDRNIKEWKEVGGIGIHHIGYQSTIAKLKALGFHK